MLPICVRKKFMRPHVRIIFQSGYPADSVQQKGLLGGEEDFLNKPISQQELVKKIREMLDK
jgi:CheY-like chemotaxis protein